MPGIPITRRSSTGQIRVDTADRPLRPREAEVLRAISAYIARHDRPPTVREIARDTGIASLGHVAHLLTTLEQRGYISRERGVSRGIHLRRPLGHPAGIGSGVPILGTIAAGVPLDLFEESEPPEILALGSHVHTDARIANGHSSAHEERSEFALRVRGNSMIEDGILDGDYVLVRPGNAALDGDIIVAVHLVGAGERGAATLKRLHFQVDSRRGRVLRVLLCPANAALEPIKILPEEWQREWVVQGTVTAIYRPYGRASRRR